MSAAANLGTDTYKVFQQSICHRLLLLLVIMGRSCCCQLLLVLFFVASSPAHRQHARAFDPEYELVLPLLDVHQTRLAQFCRLLYHLFIKSIRL